MSADLKESCKQILHRLQQQDVAEFTCLLCPRHVRGQDALMQHLIAEHHVHCVHFDNIVDLPKLLDHLSQLLHSGPQKTSWTCPVCGSDTRTADVHALVQHLEEEETHAQWNPQTISSLSAWCVAAAASEGQTDAEAKQHPAALSPSTAPAAATTTLKTSAASNNNDDDDDAAWDDMEDEEVDDDEDWNLNCVCLYCDFDGEDILDHLKSVHDFDFRSAVRQRSDVKNEYDLIRIVNVVRRAVAADRCPYGVDCAVDGKQTDRLALERHLRSESTHRLPARVTAADTDLIPVLPGDALISMLVTSGEGFLAAEEEDPDFPMVPTVQELAAAARESAPKHH